VFVQTRNGKWAIRVDGGPPLQLEAQPPARPDTPDEVRLRDVGPGVYGWPIEGGKRVLYAEDLPETQGAGKKPPDWRRRLVIAGPKGEDPKTLMTGLHSYDGCMFVPDVKAVVCGAERDGKWHVYRVPFDGAEPTRLSRTPGTEGINFQLLADGRVAYLAITGKHKEAIMIQGAVIGWTVSHVGAVVLSDGKTERVLIKESVGGLPAFAPDGSKMAVEGVTAKGEAVVVVTDLRTDKSEEFPMSAFKKDWTCQFGKLHFSPDGRALAVGFSLGSVVVRAHGPIAGDEAVEHFGVIWLDGRKKRTAVFEVGQPHKGGSRAVWELAWTRRPAGKD
jgi:hypothetical protein